LGRPFCLLCNKGEKPVRLGPVPVGRTLQPSLKQGGEAGPNGTGHGRADPSALFKARGKGRSDWDWSRSDRPLCLLESKGEWPVGLGLSWSDWAFCRSAFLMARQKRCSPGRGPPPPPLQRQSRKTDKKTQSWSDRAFFQPPFQGHGRCSRTKTKTGLGLDFCPLGKEKVWSDWYPAHTVLARSLAHSLARSLTLSPALLLARSLATKTIPTTMAQPDELFFP